MIINRPADFGALVRDRRKSLRLSQTDLAQRLKVSQRYISHLEHGKSTLQLGLVLRVLKELGVSIHVTLSADQNKTESSIKSSRPKISVDGLVDD